MFVGHGFKLFKSVYFSQYLALFLANLSKFWIGFQHFMVVLGHLWRRKWALCVLFKHLVHCFASLCCGWYCLLSHTYVDVCLYIWVIWVELLVVRFSERKAACYFLLSRISLLKYISNRCINKETNFACFLGDWRRLGYNE